MIESKMPTSWYRVEISRSRFISCSHKYQGASWDTAFLQKIFLDPYTRGSYKNKDRINQERDEWVTWKIGKANKTENKWRGNRMMQWWWRGRQYKGMVGVEKKIRKEKISGKETTKRNGEIERKWGGKKWRERLRRVKKIMNEID